jgi:hypothetical protein
MTARSRAVGVVTAGVAAVSLACSNDPGELDPVDPADRQGVQSPLDGSQDPVRPAPVDQEPEVGSVLPGAPPGPGAGEAEEDPRPGGSIPGANTPGSTTTVAPGGPQDLGPGGPP